MKKIILLVFLILPTIANAAQTPNMGMTVVPVGTYNWGPLNNANLAIIDSSAGVKAATQTWTGANTFTSTSNIYYGNGNNISFTAPISATQYNINGSTALYQTDGTGETSVGFGAGISPAGTFVGYHAGNSAVGNYNTAIGYYAGALLTTGINNTYVGAYSGESGNTGSANTYVGAYSGESGNTGSANTLVGYSIGSTNFSSSTVVGSEAGYSLQGGNANTLIGWRAGYSITTGTGNVIIGFNAAAPAAGTNNYVNIANLIYGDIPTSSVTIKGPLGVGSLTVTGNGSFGGSAFSVGGSTLVVDTGRIGIGGLVSRPSGDFSPVSILNSTPTANGMLKLQMHNVDYSGGDTAIVNSNYLQIGGRDYLVGLNNLIGFGYQPSNNTTPYLSAAYMGFTHTEDSGGHSNGDLIFLTRPLGSVASVIPSERLRIMSSGNVGINTTSPDQLLTVAGNISQTGVIISSGAGNNYFAGKIGVGASPITLDGGNGQIILTGAKAIESGSNFPSKGIYSYDSTTAGLGVGGSMVFLGNYTGTTPAGAAYIDAYKNTASAGEYGFDMRFHTRVNGGSIAEKMRITSTGFVGIGTTAPLSKLTVSSGTITIDGTGAALSVGGGAATLYYCNAGVSAGNVCRGNACSCVAGSWVSLSILTP